MLPRQFLQSDLNRNQHKEGGGSVRYRLTLHCFKQCGECSTETISTVDNSGYTGQNLDNNYKQKEQINKERNHLRMGSVI